MDEPGRDGRPQRLGNLGIADRDTARLAGVAECLGQSGRQELEFAFGTLGVDEHVLGVLDAGGGLDRDEGTSAVRVVMT